MSNPWVVQPKKTWEEVPVGTYIADFASVTDRALPDGPRWSWSWKIVTGPFAGRSAPALTKQEIMPGTHAGILIEGLLSRPLQQGEDVRASVQACIGQRYTVAVQSGPKGGKPAVRMVSKVPQEM